MFYDLKNQYSGYLSQNKDLYHGESIPISQHKKGQNILEVSRKFMMTKMNIKYFFAGINDAELTPSVADACGSLLYKNYDEVTTQFIRQKGWHVHKFSPINQQEWNIVILKTGGRNRHVGGRGV